MRATKGVGALVTMALAGAITLSVGLYGGLLDHVLFWLLLGLVLTVGFLLGERIH
jgi:hypothetical protein